VLGDPRGLEYVREAREVLDVGSHPIQFAEALSIEARFHHLAGRHRLAIELLNQAVAILPAESDDLTRTSPLASAMIQTHLAGAYQHLGLCSDSDRWARRAIGFGAAHEYPAAEAVGYEFLAENAAVAGNWREGLRYAAREREIADRIRSRERWAWTCLPVGDCHAGLGDLAAAEVELRRGLDIADEIGETRLNLLVRAPLAIVVADRRRLSEALDLAQAMFDRADATTLSYARTEARRALAYVQFRRNDLDAALRLYDEVHALLEGLDAKVTRIRIGPPHVEALLAAGRLADARVRAEEYAAMATGCQSPIAQLEAARLAALTSS
jgi:tetratricopeptide (TPR) repeat protein